MRLQTFLLTESYEDKIFTVIDKLMKLKGATNASELLSDKNMETLIRSLAQDFGVYRISLKPDPGAEGMSAYNQNSEIFLVYPAYAEVNKSFKTNLLSILLHEMAHNNVKDAGLTQYINPASKMLSDFAPYYLQGIERPAMAISSSIIAVANNVNLPEELQKLAKAASKVGSFEELNDIIHNTVDSFHIDQLGEDTVYSMFVVDGFVNSLHLQDLPTPEHKAMANMLRMKWNKLMKNINNTYRKVHAYSVRYGLWK